MTSTVIEEYLQIIYHLKTEESVVKSVSIASRIGASASTVHATITRMVRDNLIKINKRKEITFTEEGTKKAANIIYRHNIAEIFLCNILGIPWYEVHKHAHKLEHAMTPLVVEKLGEFLGKPMFCPHGSPVPGFEDFLPQDLQTLLSAPLGTKVKIISIDESLEDKEDLLKYLFDTNIIPGKEHTITDKLEATHSITLKHIEKLTTLPFDIAGKIKVTQTNVSVGA